MIRLVPCCLGLAGLAVAAGCAPTAPRPWLINETPSLPRGLYRRTADPVARGAIVAVKPPPQGRRYLAQLGARPDARLLKRVVATSGESVCRRGRWLTWPRGVAIALLVDRHGRALPRWQGCHALQAGEVLVLGDTALSFDSRYLGPMRARDIDGVYREVWRW